MQVSHKIVLFKLTVIFIFFTGCFAVSYSENYSNSFFYSEDYEIIDLLNNKKELSENEIFRLACAYKEQKNYNAAVELFKKAAFLRPNNEKDLINYFSASFFRSGFYDACIYEISDILYKQYKYNNSIRLYELLGKDDPALFIRGSLTAANCNRQLKKYDKALECLDKAAVMAEKSITYRLIISLRKAGIYEIQSEYFKASKLYFEILNRDIQSWHAAKAGKNLLLLFNEKKITLNKYQKRILSERLLISGKYNNSLNLITKDQTINARILKVKNYSYKGQYQKAEYLIKKENNLLNKAKLEKAYIDILWKRNLKTKSTSLIYKRKYHLKDKNSLLKIIDYNILKKNSSVEKYIEKYINDYGKDFSIQYRLKEAEIVFIKKGNNDLVLKLSNIYIKYFPDGYYSGNAYYYKYKLDEKFKMEDCLKKLVLNSPSSPYTWILAEKYLKNNKVNFSDLFEKSLENDNMDDSLFSHFMLFLSEGNLQKNSERIERLTKAGMNSCGSLNKKIASDKFPNSVKAYSKIFDYYFSGGYENGLTDLYIFLLNGDFPKKDTYLMMSYYSGKYRYYYRAYTSSMQLLREEKIQENISLLDNKFVERLFPKAFYSLVKKYSSEYNVDDNLVYAIMKAESAFKPQARSSSNAKGLMQVMGPTASDMARYLKMKKYDLHDSQDSIQLGTYYLKWLRDYIGNNEMYVIGAYNAGGGNMKRWIRNNRDKSFFIEKIPYDETREYILKVMKFKIQYGSIY